jgi:hypothetical protein
MSVIAAPLKSRGENWVEAASWILRFAVFLHALGFFIAVFTRMGTGWGGVALMEWSVPHDTIAYWERVGASVLLLAALSLVLRPNVLVAIVISLAVASESYARVRFGGDHFVEWSIWSSVMRFMAPLALLPLIGSYGRLEVSRLRVLASAWILRVSLAVLFAVHGMQAIGKHPGFIDLLIGSAQNLLGYRLTESNAVNLLNAIGLADICVALAILFGRWRPLLAWLCFWSAVTAFSRMTALGAGSYPEVLLRASHILAPLALWCLGTALSDLRARSAVEEITVDSKPATTGPLPLHSA